MPTEYQVKSGDCINSIAFNHGFFWETLWNHGQNSELKNKRKDPNVLKEGDVIHIPDLTLKEESGATEQRHRFRLKAVPAKLHLRFLKPKDSPPPEDEPEAGGEDDCSAFSEPDPAAAPAQEMEPIANAPYRLDIEGVITEGKSDGDGQVKVSIPPNAANGIITFHPGTPEERVFPLSLGGMDPVDTIIGARKRLDNLGYRCSTVEDEVTPELKDAVAGFQKDNGLEVNGELNDATKSKLKEKHGC